MSIDRVRWSRAGDNLIATLRVADADGVAAGARVTGSEIMYGPNDSHGSEWKVTMPRTQWVTHEDSAKKRDFRAGPEHDDTLLAKKNVDAPSKWRFVAYFFGFADAISYTPYKPPKKKDAKDKGAKKATCAACSNADWVPHTCKKYVNLLKTSDANERRQSTSKTLSQWCKLPDIRNYGKVETEKEVGLWEAKLIEKPKLPLKYGKFLVDADITLEMMPSITTSDLTTIGVSLGHAVELRRRCNGFTSADGVAEDGSFGF